MERVIFDTNAYRYLVAERTFDQIDKQIEKLRAKEKKKQIESLISPIVVKELLAHIADKGDPSFEKCHKAIKALYLHNGNKNSYRIMASPELLIAKSFFNQTVSVKEETNKALVQMAYHLALKPTKNSFTRIQRNLNQNREHVLDSENNFAQSMMQFVKGVDPSAKGWQIFAENPLRRQEILAKIRSDEMSLDIAAVYLTSVLILLKAAGKVVDLTYDKLFDMTLKFVTVFPEVIALYKFVLENLVNSEFNLFENSRSNFLWDIHLMFNVGEHTVGGDKLYFVTDDKAMTRTAIGQNAKFTILTFDEYIEYIK